MELKVGNKGKLVIREADMLNYLSKWIDLSCEYNERLMNDTLALLSKPAPRYDSVIDGMMQMYKSLLEGGTASPESLFYHQLLLVEKQIQLGGVLIRRLSGGNPDPVISPMKTDLRFTSDEWQNNAVFDYIKQSYLLNSQALLSMSEFLDIDDENKASLDYYLRQFSSALAPSNFALTNPEVLKKIRDTKGENLFHGVRQFIEDQVRSADFLNVCMSDGDNFCVGENLAATQGKVVFENSLMQIIQYEASTDKVFSVPILIVPSWINKYYILDLREKNSFVKWAVDQGLSVYMISWVNPDESHRDVGFDDYLEHGLLQAVKEVKKISGCKEVNSIGYCLGGVLLASALSYMAHHKDRSISSATYLATSLDFENPGDMQVFLNERTVKVLENYIDDVGCLDGRLLSLCFNMLRENELYWNYFVQNYLKGERPRAFDILYWNCDNTNVTAKTHKFVLRDLHLNNGLVNNDISLLQTPVDLSAVKTPLYVLAMDKDHIARWQSAYSAVQLQRGKRRFVLAGSGHIAGVINHPDSNKYYYYTNTKLNDCPDEWLAGADKSDGSWWGDWLEWVQCHSRDKVEAPAISEDCVVEDAPGRYVKRRLDNQELSEL